MSEHTFGHMGGQPMHIFFSQNLVPQCEFRHFCTRTVSDGPGQTGRDSSGVVKIRLLFLYSESYTIIGDFCPKPFGLFLKLNISGLLKHFLTWTHKIFENMPKRYEHHNEISKYRILVS